MISNSHKTSLLIPSQLPEFIRDNPDYSKFVSFVQAYYEWMEQEGGVTDGSKNILNYNDIDRTTNQFVNYYINDFLPNFPSDALVNKRLAVKIAKQLYETKGTPASYKFLFRVLYNSDFDVFYTKDAVLKSSSGIWYIPKSLRLSTTDSNFRKIDNLRILGESSGAIATIENSILSKNKTEVFVSNIERLFASGETVRVVDNLNQTIYFKDGKVVSSNTPGATSLRAKLVGQINQINIDPDYRGSYYLTGDPIVIYNGTNPDTTNPVEAKASVGDVTKGSIKQINTLTYGYGYRDNPNTKIIITGIQGAIARVGSFVVDPASVANVTVCVDSIYRQTILKTIPIGNTRYNFANNANANSNTTLANAFSFVSFSTYPLSSVVIDNGGGGGTAEPTVYADSIYSTDSLPYNNDAEYGIAHLAKLGILSPIQIVNSGVGYLPNDMIQITNGSGYGAFANVITTNANGSINTVSYVSGTYLSSNNKYPLGGLGYRADSLPTLNVISANANAYGALLVVPGILGDGATFSTISDRIGSISTINITNYGEDYSSKPNVSIKIMDVLVSNVTVFNLPKKNDFAYQGNSITTSTMSAYVDSISLIRPDNDPTKSLYSVRLYNYSTRPNTNLVLKIKNKNISMVLANTTIDNTRYDSSGIITYGDGKALASATFLNGLSFGRGQYLSSRGLLSSFDVLQNEDYNNYTYQITVEKEIEKYRNTLLNLLHPSGLKVIGRYAIKSNSSFNLHSLDALSTGYNVNHYTGYPGTTATITTDFKNKTNNIIQFNNLAGANIATFIFPNTSTSETTISISPTNGPNVVSEVISVDYIANTVTIKNNVWLTFANVAISSANSGSNTINIIQLTGVYDYFNNGNYSNTKYPLKDIVYVGDTIYLSGNTGTVKSVDYVNGIITLTSNFNANANSYLSVKRNFVANGSQIYLFGKVGTQYVPELITESGQTIVTEDNSTILLG